MPEAAIAALPAANASYLSPTVTTTIDLPGQPAVLRTTVSSKYETVGNTNTASGYLSTIRVETDLNTDSSFLISPRRLPSRTEITV